MGNTLEQLAHVVRNLEGTDNWEDGLKHILENEIRRRLNRYELADQRFQRKYSLDFAAFRQAGMVKKLGYSYEAESDFCDWEMALSSIRTLKQQLTEVAA